MKMNKYEKEWSKMSNFEKHIQEIEAIVRNSSEMNHGSYQGQYSLSKLKELVDRATPMKPPKHDKVVCPTCNSKANYGHPYTEYCCHCGQAIDWEGCYVQ